MYFTIEIKGFDFYEIISFKVSSSSSISYFLEYLLSEIRIELKDFLSLNFIEFKVKEILNF